MNTKRYYFVTDAHFGSLAHPSKERELKMLRWLDSIQADCEALFLMGDMIDFWYEYPYVVPKGFTRFFGKLAQFTDAGIPVYWFAGNHDIWLYSYVQDELGVKVLHEPCEMQLFGKRFFLAHGDGLGDKSFSSRFLHWFFRSRVNQFLFTHLLPTSWGMRFGQAWSKHSYNKRKKEDVQQYLGEDKEHLIAFAKEDVARRQEEAAAPDSDEARNALTIPDFYVFGHRHIVLDFCLANGSRVLILGDWISEFSYGVFDGEFFDILHFEED